MTKSTINATQFKAMCHASAVVLAKHAKYINSLNVFPVPDGDTGTNLKFTVGTGNKYVQKDQTQNTGKLTQDFAEGLLMGARGNSGVITSQIFRGFASALKNKEQFTVKDLANAFSNGAKVAYQSVMKPTEGTILSIIRKAAHTGQQNLNQSLPLFFSSLTNTAEKALQATPDELAVLKKAGVVDSGGQGLVLLLKAWSTVVNGKDLNTMQKPSPEEMQELIKAQHHQNAQSQLDPNQIKYGYCTQMTVRFGKGKEYDRQFSYQPFYDYLATLGNSLLVANNQRVVKVHVHTEHPGKVLAFGQHYGDLTKVKVDNMRKQQMDMIKKHNGQENIKGKKQQIPHVRTAVLAVADGIGMQKLFRSLHSAVVTGGATTNPDVKSFLTVMKTQTNADQYVLLPNNKNVYMTAKLVKQKSKKPVEIIKTPDMQSGLASFLGYNPKQDAKTNAKSMTKNIDNVSGAISRATRSVLSNGIAVHEDDYLGILQGKIVVSHPSLFVVIKTLLQKMVARSTDSDLLTIFKQKKNDHFLDIIMSQAFLEVNKSLSGSLDIEKHYGGQSNYSFLLSLE